MDRSEQLRVALFTGNYNIVRDGANRALNRLVGYLEARGVAVRIFSPTVEAPAFEPTGQLVSMPSVPIPGRPEYRVAYRFGKTGWDELNAFKPHMVHLSAPDIMNHAAKRYALARGLPVLASYHTRFETYLDYYRLTILSGFVRGIIRRFYEGCDIAFVPSPSVKDYFDENNITVPIGYWSRGVNGTDFSPARRDDVWRKANGIPDEKPIVVFVGRLVKEKGLDLFIASDQRMRARGLDYTTLIVGDGPERADLAAALPHAHFTGHLDRAALTKAYANSDIFFNPSVTEAFGNVTLEAMASGLALVCSHASGSKDMTEHGRNGYLAKPGDVDDHCKYIEKLLTDDQLRQSMGRESRALAQKRRWRNVMADLFEGYQQVLQARYPDKTFLLSQPSEEKLAKPAQGAT